MPLKFHASRADSSGQRVDQALGGIYEVLHNGLMRSQGDCWVRSFRSKFRSVFAMTLSLGAPRESLALHGRRFIIWQASMLKRLCLVSAHLRARGIPDPKELSLRLGDGEILAILGSPGRLAMVTHAIQSLPPRHRLRRMPTRVENWSAPV